MKITSTEQSAHEIDADAVVIGCWKDEPLEGAAQEIDRQMNGTLTNLIDSGEIATTENTVTSLLAVDSLSATVLAVVGLGKKQDAKPWLAFRAAGSAAKHLATRERNRVAFYLDVQPHSDAVCGSIVGCHGQDLFRTEKKLFPFGEIIWRFADAEQLRQGEVIGRAMGLTRKLVNLPASDIYPESFADVCLSTGQSVGFDVEIWDQEKLESENCGALLAVARGSDRSARLAIMRHQGGPSDQKPLALVGKGVTFDSGGLSLKPSEAMVDMKCDMAGAATVVGAMQAIAEMNLPINVWGFVGLVENMVSGRSYKLGDVLKSRSGKSVEVLNTDAEGRLVLADVLNVAVTSGVEKIIDLATLTGACMVALGKNTAGLMTNNQDWLNTVRRSAQQSGEPAWELPMFDEYAKQIKSEVADIKNIGEGRWGGAITAAKFLEEFVEDVPWVHIDIAGPSFADKPSPWIDAGASGCFVRTLFAVAAGLVQD